MSGDAVRARWLELTRRELPALASARGWPVRADHCFQRILLDNAFGGRWYDHVAGRPAYAHADPAALARAVALGEAAIAGTEDMAELDRRSLEWRGKRGPSKPGAAAPISGSANPIERR
ncbi:GCN5-related N-acetyltransferase [Sphingomonas sp. VNH70]|uniref:GCN5-related N-acetyltransferase n=1 Tax=Sphingomonas silueang TaxID=3156617 RepID=UPI0032B61A72